MYTNWLSPSFSEVYGACHSFTDASMAYIDFSI